MIKWESVALGLPLPLVFGSMTVLLSSSFKSIRVLWEWDSPNEFKEVSEDFGVFVVEMDEKADKEFDEESVDVGFLSLIVSFSFSSLVVDSSNFVGLLLLGWLPCDRTVCESILVVEFVSSLVRWSSLLVLICSLLWFGLPGEGISSEEDRSSKYARFEEVKGAVLKDFGPK